MKIAVIGPAYPYRGGIAHYTTMLASKLINAGHETSIISFRRQYPAWLYPGKTDKDPSKPVIELETKFTLDPVYPWTWIGTVNEIKRIHPDLILIAWWTTFWAPGFWVLARLLSRDLYKVVFLIHNVIPHEDKPWDRWIAQKVLQQGSAYIVQSDNEKKRLRSLLPDSEPVICPHPVYNQFIGLSSPAEDTAEQLQALKKNLPTLLFFGIVRPYKGLQYLIEAVSILKDSGVLVQLIIAGEFWEKKQHYKELIMQLELDDQVLLFDQYIPDDQVSLFFNQANIFVAPYVAGTQSGSAKIALSFDLPIVATECIADSVLKSSERVTVIPPADSVALASVIENIIEGGFPERNPILQDDSSWNLLVSTIEDLGSKT
ncbi:MAG: glycosyltransferase [Anaerolineales bacterium]